MSIHHLERAAILPLQSTRKLVFMALCDDADKATGIALPGLEAVKAWAGCGKSQVQEHIAALIEVGLVERVSTGRRGRRAEYRVFARVACCSEHEPTSDPLDSASENGSGQPEANDESPATASGKGPDSVRFGSGPDRTPPQQFIPPSSGEGYVLDSPVRDDDRDPTPHEDLGGRPRTEPVPLARQDRCVLHQLDDFPPPCRGCKTARETHEQAKRDAARAEVERERAARAEAARLQRLDIDQCRMCDETGYVNGRVCDHDPESGQRAARGAAAVRAALMGVKA